MDARLPQAIAAAIDRDFGSVDRWRAEFVALATALAGGSGWVLLTYVPRDGRLINQSSTDDSQAVAGGIPILALDMYEHAFHIEFGANAVPTSPPSCATSIGPPFRRRYEDAIKVTPPRSLEQKEFKDTPSITVEEVRAMLESGTQVQLIDTRPRHYTAKAQDMIAGAVWRDPERVDEWIGALSKAERSSPSASMGSTSAARLPRSCVRPGSTRGTCPAGTTRGRPSRDPSSCLSEAETAPDGTAGGVMRCCRCSLEGTTLKERLNLGNHRSRQGLMPSRSAGLADTPTITRYFATAW